MTFRQKHDILLQLVIEKWKIYEEKDKEAFATQGFADIDLQTSLQRAYLEWQRASNDANNFLIFFKNSGKHPNDEV